MDSYIGRMGVYKVHKVMIMSLFYLNNHYNYSRNNRCCLLDISRSLLGIWRCWSGSKILGRVYWPLEGNREGSCKMNVDNLIRKSGS